MRWQETRLQMNIALVLLKVATVIFKLILCLCVCFNATQNYLSCIFLHPRPDRCFYAKIAMQFIEHLLHLCMLQKVLFGY